MLSLSIARDSYRSLSPVECCVWQSGFVLGMCMHDEKPRIAEMYSSFNLGLEYVSIGTNKL